MFQVNNKNTQKGFELGSNFKKKKGIFQWNTLFGVFTLNY